MKQRIHCCKSSTVCKVRCTETSLSFPIVIMRSVNFYVQDKNLDSNYQCLLIGAQCLSLLDLPRSTDHSLAKAASRQLFVRVRG